VQLFHLAADAMGVLRDGFDKGWHLFGSSRATTRSEAVTRVAASLSSQLAFCVSSGLRGYSHEKSRTPRCSSRIGRVASLRTMSEQTREEREPTTAPAAAAREADTGAGVLPGD
jgi:hypothetical protein